MAIGQDGARPESTERPVGRKPLVVGWLRSFYFPKGPTMNQMEWR